MGTIFLGNHWLLVYSRNVSFLRVHTVPVQEFLLGFKPHLVALKKISASCEAASQDFSRLRLVFSFWDSVSVESFPLPFLTTFLTFLLLQTSILGTLLSKADNSFGSTSVSCLAFQIHLSAFSQLLSCVSNIPAHTLFGVLFLSHSPATHL